VLFRGSTIFIFPLEKTGLKEKIELTEIGKYNLLEKIILERNFLAPDAETIAEFVDVNIRRIEGINRTQTIIPGISKMKNYLRL
jgi:hypothetical protein